MAAPVPVSVVIPAWNAARSIVRTLESVTRQTAPPAEVIIVDDGSTDATAALAQDWITRHPQANARLIRQANAGPGGARNTGARASTQPWIAFLDGDDEWLPAKLAGQLAALERTPHLDLLSARLVHEPQGASGRAIPRSFRRLLLMNSIATSSVLLRRSVFEQVGGFTPGDSHSEDYYLWLQIAAAGYAIAVLDTPLVIYDEGKPTFGFSGISGDLRRVFRGELRTFLSLWRSGDLSAPGLVLSTGWAALRFQRRVLLTRLRG